ncbi:hypothetical protein SAMN05216389_106161 [Oceanobacillus limi]|uniref:Uncharacterized protein n=1 Tax=Oceanobacillus limi TaxID=930131 RepID=A0A1I0CCN2_9BACI|nr:hypothetical protein [Oceanobacillus limi]SET17288.1 hypothetical protein SAMN05216389_106161 [Oceanobacillus limi]
MSSKHDAEIKSLLSISPKAYRFIVNELEANYHIHSYDIQASGIKKKDGIHIILRFGEQFTNKEERFFLNKQVESLGDELREFVESTGETCKQVLIDDYFKTMAP